MSEVPLHLAPPVQEISQENFQPSVEEEVIEVILSPFRAQLKKLTSKLTIANRSAKLTRTRLRRSTEKERNLRC